LVADDDESWRLFVHTILGTQPGWHVVGEASDGLEAVQKPQELIPDVILLDIGLPTLSGIDAARRIHEVAPNSRILFLSALDSPDIVEEALHTGANGYLLKLDAGRELVSAMQTVSQGKHFVSSSLKGMTSNAPLI
jgi:DNA-binding NarL/FixJ family response regulator